MQQQTESSHIDPANIQPQGFNGEPEKSKILLNEGDKEHPPTDRDVNVLNQKLRIQNEKLRSQLKELSYKLTETLEKVKHKKNPDKGASEFRDETLRKEMDNASKQVQYYQKEVEKLKYKIDSTHTYDRVTKLENALRDKERVIEEMTVEKRNLEKIKRDQEKQLDVLKNDRDYITRLNMYAEEMKGLKDKIREMQKYEKHEEKSFKKQQEYLVILEGKYREVCEKAGVSASLNFSTSTEMNDRNLRFKSAKVRENSQSVGPQDLKKIGVQSTRNIKQSPLNENRKGADDEKIELTEAKFKEMKNIIEILKKAKSASDRRYKAEIDQLNSKIKEQDFNLNQLKSDLREKEKELNIFMYKYNELKRLTKHQQLAPIDQPSAQKPTDKSLDKSKSSQQLQTKASPKSQSIQGRKEKKGRVNVKGLEFDDFAVSEKDVKISKLTVWFDKDQIYGVRAVYSIKNGSDIAGAEHLAVEQKNDLTCQAFDIDVDDRIAVVSGKYKNFIGYLKFATAKGKTHEFGDENGKNSTTPFIFDIETNEQPSVLFGAFDKIEGNNNALAYLGFQITKIEDQNEIKDETANNKH